MYNSVILDLLYFGPRTMVHSNLPVWFKFVTFLFMSMGIFDLTEIFIKSRYSEIKAVFMEDIEALQVNFLKLNFILFYIRVQMSPKKPSLISPSTISIQYLNKTQKPSNSTVQQ